MKKNSTNQSARRGFRAGGFLNLRVLIGLFIIVAGVSLAFLATAKPPVGSLNQPAQKYNPTGSSIDLSVLPPGFDCSQIHQKGIDRQDNMRAGAIMTTSTSALRQVGTLAAWPRIRSIITGYAPTMATV